MPKTLADSSNFFFIQTNIIQKKHNNMGDKVKFFDFRLQPELTLAQIDNRGCKSTKSTTT